MKNGFRVGLLGAGYVSEFHVAALRRVRCAQIVGVADLDQKRAIQLVQRHRLPRAFGSLDELIKAGANVIHILTPPATHANAAVTALERGCHVLVEKPLATSVEDCDRVDEVAKRAGKSVCVNHSNLRDPFVARAIQLAKSGAIGEILGADYFRSSNYPPYRGGPLPPQYTTGGYPFRDMGVHGLYLLQELLGDIEDVSAEFRTAGGDPNLLYDEWSAQLRCKSGLGRMRLSWNVMPLSNELVIEGTRGVIRADMFAMYVSTRKQYRLPTSVGRILNGLREAWDIGTQVPVNVLRVACGRLRRFHGLQNLVGEFYEALEHDRPMPVSIRDARGIVHWTESVARRGDAAKHEMRSCLERPRRATILVTGANGFIGRRLVARLLQLKTPVRILVRSEPPAALSGNPLVETVWGDLGDPIAVDRAVADTEVIFHVGAAMRGAAHDFDRGTIVGTQNVVASALRHRVQKLVYVSSLSVLHAVAKGPSDKVRENWPLEPLPDRRGAYSRSKLAAERIVMEAVERESLPAVIFRPGQVFGPEGNLITPAVGLRFKRSLLVIGSGQGHLPLIHVEDVVDALVGSLTKPVFDGSIFHLVDSESITQLDLAARIARCAAGGLSVKHIPRWCMYAVALTAQTACAILRRKSPLCCYRLQSALRELRFDCQAARERLDWIPRVGVRAGLDELFAETPVPHKSLST